ncbi:MAG: RluA family pseudouridine synthase [Lachnospiraceae bacterium]|nr:RluA family pseudouridine synthase [Lachnospiraceae bacterium]
MKQIIIDQKDSEQRVDKYLQRILPNAGKSFLYKMMRKKNIVLNDKSIKGNEIIKKDDVLKIWFSDETYEKMSAVQNTFDIDEWLRAYRSLKGIKVEYEDDDHIVLYKPAGILTQKAVPGDLSLNEWLLGYLYDDHKIDEDSLKTCKPSVTNRLDRNTSGLVLAGKTLFGINTFTGMIKDHKIRKFYNAYVKTGLPDSGHLIGYLKKNRDHNISEVIDSDHFSSLSDKAKEGYERIETKYNILGSTYIPKANTTLSLLNIELLTGKSHQIRAQFASLGYPLAGDMKYGDSEFNKMLGLNSQLLHAYRIVMPADDKLGDLSGKTIDCSINIRSLI